MAGSSSWAVSQNHRGVLHSAVSNGQATHPFKSVQLVRISVKDVYRGWFPSHQHVSVAARKERCRATLRPGVKPRSRDWRGKECVWASGPEHPHWLQKFHLRKHWICMHTNKLLQHSKNMCKPSTRNVRNCVLAAHDMNGPTKQCKLEQDRACYREIPFPYCSAQSRAGLHLFCLTLLQDTLPPRIRCPTFMRTQNFCFSIIGSFGWAATRCAFFHPLLLCSCIGCTCEHCPVWPHIQATLTLTTPVFLCPAAYLLKASTTGQALLSLTLTPSALVFVFTCQ